MERMVLEALVAEDLTVRAIADRLGCGPTNVRYWLKRHGLETTSAARRRHVAAPGERIEGSCARHGPVEVVVAGDGSRRCVRCRSEAVTRSRRRTKALLVEEAGGRVTDYRGDEPDLDGSTGLVASNGPLHERLVEVTREADY